MYLVTIPATSGWWRCSRRRPAFTSTPAADQTGSVFGLSCLPAFYLLYLIIFEPTTIFNSNSLSNNLNHFVSDFVITN